MRKILFSPAAIALVAGSLSAPAQQSTFLPAADAGAAPAAPKALRSFDTTAIDKTVDPCTDFYQYACGNWRRNNPIPADSARWGTFNQLSERNNYLLYTELKQAGDAPKSPLQKQYGTFFAACMDVDQANRLGAKPIEPSLMAIDAISDKRQIAAFLGSKQYFSDGFFGFNDQQDQKDSTKQIASLRQGGLLLPDRDYYLQTDERQVKIRTQYQAFLVNMFKLIGDDQTKAEAEAKNVLEIETALAKGAMPRVEMRDPDKIYHPMAVGDLKTLTPDFDWTAFFAGVQPPAFTTVNVLQPDYFKTMATVIADQPLPALKSYLRIHAVAEIAPWLSSQFDEAYFDFFSKTLNGQAEQRARWKRCTALTDRQFGEAVGQDWVKQNFPPENKASMEQLVANLKESLGEDIKQLPWMSDATKQEALTKLGTFRDKVGYPDQWRDYSAVVVTRGDFATDLRDAENFNTAYELNHIGKPVNEKEWGMTPPTVNAYYNPPMNDINFPAGILQPPFYSQTIDPAVNYGAIGVVIGHEMTHGFDDQGSRYDGQGNVRNWFTPDDKAKFDARTDCEVKEYGNFEPVPGQKLNGKLTLGENTADNGGIRISYQALQKVLAAEPEGERTKKIDGYTPDQRFFIAFAQVWCSNTTDASARVLAKTDPHSPGEFRTNGTVQNFEQFGKAFGCHSGQPMMPANSCHVW
ncbi:M13 family metallopeptidase [Acidipila sp. EB88]|uniref:M13 family metallopeptidase n=1 Tax=Acidipila sp. EB88 TaxID=2305226 RepID=UPI000F5F9C7B|nr:M13 family metallopeptidase [Acidipila sp. EB88]RRA48730.1 M13 family peptidase [Acidipila sp. EB88]